jgi:hypothetical protein
MTDINPTPNNTDTPSDETLNTKNPVPYDRFQQVNEARRLAEERLAKLEKAAQDKDAETLAKNQEWEKLANQYKAELDSKASIESEAKRYRDRLEADNLARIERIPEDKRSLIPEYDDPVKLGAWLTANEVTLTGTVKPIAPNLGGGAGGNVKQPDYKLSQFELDMAKAAGMSPERYAQQKAKKGQALDLDELKKQKNKEI